MNELFQLSQHLIRTHNRPYERRFLQKKPFNSRFSILLGERGVGKSTAIIQYIMHYCKNSPTPGKVLFVQADHFLVNKFSLYEIADKFHTNGGELICFDEIHKYPKWSAELKSLYDTFPSLKLIASGSSALEILKGSHDLSRRVIINRLRGLSFREYLELSLNLQFDTVSLSDILYKHTEIASAIINKLDADKQRVMPLFRKYLVNGYYPYFHEFEDVENFKTVVEKGIQAAIEADLPSVHPSLTGASVHKIKKLLSYLASAVPFTPDMRKLKILMDIGDERTLKNYLSYMHDAGVISLIPAAGKGMGTIGKNGKIYLANPNQYHAINRTINNEGSVRETFFVSMLSGLYKIAIPEDGDFFVDEKFVFEIGGKSKDFSQIKDVENSFLALDEMEIGYGNKIPIWLFGFLS